MIEVLEDLIAAAKRGEEDVAAIRALLAAVAQEAAAWPTPKASHFKERFDALCEIVARNQDERREHLDRITKGRKALRGYGHLQPQNAAQRLLRRG